jgi:hypothetical protein
MEMGSTTHWGAVAAPGGPAVDCTRRFRRAPGRGRGGTPGAAARAPGGAWPPAAGRAKTKRAEPVLAPPARANRVDRYFITTERFTVNVSSVPGFSTTW